MSPNEFPNLKLISSSAARGRALVFHAQNMELAEVSLEAQSWLSQRTTDTSEINDAFENLKAWNQETNPVARDGQTASYVNHLTINVAQICNLACVYCAAGGDGTYGDPVAAISVAQTLPQISFFIEKAPENSSFQLNFIGGEPLLYPQIIQAIVDHAVIKGLDKNLLIQTHIVSNGTLSNQDVLNMLAQTRAHLTVSLDGPASINDLQRPTKNGQTSSTESVLQSWELFKKIRPYLSGLNLHAVFNENHFDVLMTYQFFKTLNPDAMTFTWSLSDLNKEASQKWIESYQKALDLAYQTGQEIELRKITLVDQYFKALDSQVRSRNHCGLGKNLVVLSARNEAYQCPWEVGDSQKKVGQKLELEPLKLRGSQTDLSKDLVDINNCQTCWARHLCGGGCSYAHSIESQARHKKSETFCERTRNLSEIILTYYSLVRLSH